MSLLDFPKTDRQRETIITWEECNRNFAYVKNTAPAEEAPAEEAPAKEPAPE